MPHNRFLINPAKRVARYYHDHSTRVIVALVIAALLCITGYQAYAYQQAKTNKQTAAKVVQLSKGKCGDTKFVYQLLNDLALDSSPHYGSPVGQPVVPGARAAKLNHLFALERKAVKPLKRQGCDISGIIPKDVTE